MRRSLAWVSAGLLSLAGAGGASSAAPQPAREHIVVTLKQQAGLSGISGSRSRRLREVIHRRMLVADTGYAAFGARLAAWRRNGRVTSVTRLWVVNGFALTATPDVAAALRADRAVARVATDAAAIVPAASGPVEWNLDTIGAPAIWERAATGQGVVVATLDSGVDIDHPDLAARWRGGTNSWFDPYGQQPSVPVDLTGHGTGVMGVILGGDAGGTAVGVAPGAKWISARIFNDRGTSMTSAIHQAFQWLLDPDGNPATADAPQVVNASWSFANPGCNLEFAPDIQALRAAEILPVFAAGNFGAAAASPANNPGALAVGSTSSTDAIAVDSSRGPSACGEPSAVFPEITAPGVAIRTTDLGGLYATYSGTSLAAPHVAGALALLLSARPNLTPADQEAALEQTAVDLGVPGPDDTFGYGRLDAANALRWTTDRFADVTGPAVSDASASPSVTRDMPVVLTATAVDAAGATAAAEWFDGADPGPGNGHPMAATDGAFGQATESVNATIDASALPAGDHSLSVRARDAAGNWGPTSSVAVTVIAALPTTPDPTPPAPPDPTLPAPPANTPLPQAAATHLPTFGPVLGSRTLRLGMRGPDVERLQRILRGHGLRVTANGTFGPRTRNAVRLTQRRLHLRPTGVADLRFLARLGIRPRPRVSAVTHT